MTIEYSGPPRKRTIAYRPRLSHVVELLGRPGETWSVIGEATENFPNPGHKRVLSGYHLQNCETGELGTYPARMLTRLTTA